MRAFVHVVIRAFIHVLHQSKTRASTVYRIWDKPYYM